MRFHKGTAYLCVVAWGACALAEPLSKVTELKAAWKKCDAAAQTAVLAKFESFPEAEQKALVRAASEKIALPTECTRRLSFQALERMRSRGADVVEALVGLVERRSEFLAAPGNPVSLVDIASLLKSISRDPIAAATLRNAYRAGTPSTRRLLLHAFSLDEIPAETAPDWVETLKSPIRQDASGKWRVPDNEIARSAQLLAPRALSLLHRDHKVDALTPLRAALETTRSDRELRSAVLYGLARSDDKGATTSLWMTELAIAGKDAPTWLAAAEGWDRVTQGKADLKAFSGDVKYFAKATCRFAAKNFEVAIGTLGAGDPIMAFVGSRRLHPFRFSSALEPDPLSFVAPGSSPSLCDATRTTKLANGLIAIWFRETRLAEGPTLAIAIYDPGRDEVLDARNELGDAGWKWEDGFLREKRL